MDQEPDDAIPSDVKLQLRREAVLKRVLFQHTLEREGAIYERDPAMVQRKGSLLNQCYTFTMGCPLLLLHTKHGEKTAKRVREVLLLLPTLNKHVQPGTKREILATLSDFFVAIFLLQRRTALESVSADHLLLHLPSPARQSLPACTSGDAATASADDDADDACILRRRKLERLKKILDQIMKDFEVNGGPGRLVEVLRGAKTTLELPPLYREFFDTLKQLSAPALLDIINDPVRVEKLKALYARVPESAIVNTFRFTNPLKLMSTLSALLFLNIGGKPLLQRIILVLTDTHRMEKDLHDVGSQIPAGIRTSILNFIQANYPFDSEADCGVINQGLVLAALGSRHGEVSQDLLHLCARYFGLEMERRRTAEYLQLIGSPQLMKILKKVLAIFHQPLLNMFHCMGDIPKILTRTFAALRKVIKIGEATMVATEERIRQYQEIVDELQEMGYTLLHKMAEKDQGTLHSLADWLVGSWLKGDHVLDIEALLVELTKEEHAELWKACDAITQHGLQGGSRLNTPTFPIIDKVVSIFQQLCVGGPYQLASSDSLVSASSSSD